MNNETIILNLSKILAEKQSVAERCVEQVNYLNSKLNEANETINKLRNQIKELQAMELEPEPPQERATGVFEVPAGTVK